MAKRKLLQDRAAMRGELKSIKSDWPMIEDAAGVPSGTVKAFVEKDEITDENLAKLDELNRQ